jgi:hypothetical protein
MTRRVIAMLVAATFCSLAVIIDRIAVKVGKRVITESAILQEIRLTSFLNGERPDFSSTSMKKTADRMVDQLLFLNEMELSQYPPPQPSEVDTQLAKVKREHFPDETKYRAALASYGVTEEELKQFLQRQIYILGFIDARFRPGVQITEREMLEFYAKKFVPEWNNKSKAGPPNFGEVKSQIEQALTADRVNQLIEAWLKEARTRTRVEFMNGVFP